MADSSQRTSETKRKNDMPYAERLARYEQEKMQLPRVTGDNKTYEAALKALAKKWRI